MSRNSFPPRPILIVDDEVQLLRSVSIALRASGITHVAPCHDSRDVLPFLAAQETEVVLLDLTMPHVPGEEILSMVVAEYPDIPVIIITGTSEVETAVRCMQAGAFDYMVKPVETSRLVSGVRRAIELRELQRENRLLRERVLSGGLERPEHFADIVTRNPSMRSIFQYIEAIAPSAQPVLITGETGTGKELIAKAVHTLSNRPGEFVPVNVAGLDDSHFADTLFGHTRGAFTGADRARAGLVEKASGGTLFLDEIGDLSLGSQVKLLRLLQESEYRPLGSDVAKRSTARMVVATNQDLTAAMHSGEFRKDLYYRLRSHHIHVPPLRDRKDDLPLLTNHFLQEASRCLGKKVPTASEELLALLGTHHYPGNVRELRAMIFDIMSSHSSGTLSLERLRMHMDCEAPTPQEAPCSVGSGSTPLITFAEHLPTLKEANRLLIAEAMRRAQNNQTAVARLLGITRQTLNRYLRSESKKKSTPPNPSP